MKKYIFITGGVSSSLGKGLAAASLASLIEKRGININMLKMDPYINVDPGTMSPYQHGEVFVTDDGAETDLDLGHYERFTNLNLSKTNNFTTGQVYLNVIENEREGKYLGKTVQVVPHITDEIKRRIHLAAQNVDLLIAEIGGTVGDIESLPFIEAIRQFSHDVGPQNVVFIHLVYIPYLKAADELKSKPAQHSVKELRSQGVVPNIILCRAEQELHKDLLEKISLFCDVPQNQVFQSIDADSIYKLPMNFYNQGLDEKIIQLLGIWAGRPQLKDLRKFIHNIENPVSQITIGIVGKYTELKESYKSLHEALYHGQIFHQVEMKTVYIQADELNNSESQQELLSKVDGILVPGGFGNRGTEGKIQAIKFARENQIPFFGICLGLQLAVIEFARHVTHLTHATSEEFSLPGEFVIHFMDGQEENAPKGGSMRLGAYDCSIKKDSLAYKIYKKTQISERHRHRFEVNNKFRSKLSDAGMIFSGINEKLDLVEVIELPEHPFFIASQFHPEFKSGPFKPHPLFTHFIGEAANYKRSQQ